MARSDSPINGIAHTPFPTTEKGRKKGGLSGGIMRRINKGGPLLSLTPLEAPCSIPSEETVTVRKKRGNQRGGKRGPKLPR